MRAGFSVLPGTPLILGRRYRLIEVDASDPGPSLRPGAIVICEATRSGDAPDIAPEWDDFISCWTADYSPGDGYQTLVSRLELLPEVLQ